MQGSDKEERVLKVYGESEEENGFRLFYSDFPRCMLIRLCLILSKSL